jgi:DNA-binding transcriptional regulator LsrR (DeoR family)
VTTFRSRRSVFAGAQFLKREIENGETALIGIGHGRTLAACVEYLPRTVNKNIRFVSLLGGLTRKFAANPHDVIHRLADRVPARKPMSCPCHSSPIRWKTAMFVQSTRRARCLQSRQQADLLFVGIGTVEREASLVATGMIEMSEIEEIKKGGGVGEFLGHFFDCNGQPIETALSNRTFTLSREDLKNRRVVAVAGGKFKSRAIRAVLESGYLSGLITETSADCTGADEIGGIGGICRLRRSRPGSAALQIWRNYRSGGRYGSHGPFTPQVEEKRYA